MKMAEKPAVNAAVPEKLMRLLLRFRQWRNVGRIYAFKTVASPVLCILSGLDAG